MKPLPPPSPKLTFFHALWLAVVFCAAFVGYATPDGAGPWTRIAIAAVSGIAGVIVGGPLVTLLVTAVVIPRLRRGSYWEYEVECYMLGLFGKRWEDAGKPPE